MIQKLKAKANNKKGFTLAELLIVVAIIGVLVAIAVPIFKAQLDGAKSAVTLANQRSAKSMAYAQYLVDTANGTETAKQSDGTYKYYAHLSGDNNEDMILNTTADGAAYTVIISTAGIATVS